MGETPTVQWENMLQTAQNLVMSASQNFIEVYLWKILESFAIIISWIILSFLLYKCIIYIFARFNILWLINKLELKIAQWVGEKKWKEETKALNEKTKFTKKFKLDRIIAKAVAYYVFLLFFRYAITKYGILDIENFMDELLQYLPKLFIWAMIWYLWFRFSKFIHDIVFYAFWVETKETAKIIATGMRGIIIFFTVMAVLDQVWIATEITTTILNWFIAMLALAWGLAFGLWGKDVAREILESFRK